MIQQEGQGGECGVGRTHVAITDDTPLLRAREQVARFCETFDKLLLRTKRVSRELELPRQGGSRDGPLRLTRQIAPLSTLDRSLLKGPQ